MKWIKPFIKRNFNFRGEAYRAYESTQDQCDLMSGFLSDGMKEKGLATEIGIGVYYVSLKAYGEGFIVALDEEDRRLEMLGESGSLMKMVHEAESEFGRMRILRIRDISTGAKNMGMSDADESTS